MIDQIRVAVFDEHPLFRRGVVNAIERNRGMVVVAEGASLDARKIAASTEFDILLLGVRGGELDVAREMLAARSGLRVVIMTASEKEEHLSEAIRAGTAGYILKGVSAIELLRALDAVHKGEHYITPSLALRIVVQRLQPLPPEVADAAESSIGLTNREQEVLSHLAQGLTRTEIAIEIGVSFTAVKHNITNLFRKIRVRNRMEAIAVAQKLNLV